ncbi:hypothetical protein K933_17082 [Candidatus Halobonum tyrrellensis G22]|uniref:Uncharacterized protein n=1 Tax=Candidatus Halobonum tyrrellensis G22 TaxID=1324957 RepID=V4H9W8_9EURY|nr:hypothetical protein K933_17082 [Candidatus Halobonum tyrrellensis G22]
MANEYPVDRAEQANGGEAGDELPARAAVTNRRCLTASSFLPEQFPLVGTLLLIGVNHVSDADTDESDPGLSEEQRSECLVLSERGFDPLNTGIR